VGKRIAAVGLIAVLAGILVSGALATPAVTNLPTKLTQALNPAHMLNAPYALTSSGTLTHPTQVCPTGNRNPIYCTTVSRSVCHGQVQITVQLLPDKLLADSGKVVAMTTAPVSASCSYSKRVALKASVFRANTRHLPAHSKYLHVGVAVFAKFLGNAQLAPSSAKTQVVNAKVVKP
jgi:hypothetical protein